MKPLDTPIEMTDTIKEELKSAFGDLIKITSDFSITRDKGYYGVCFGMPSKNVRNSLSTDRELLILVSTFEDQQARPK